MLTNLWVAIQVTYHSLTNLIKPNKHSLLILSYKESKLSKQVNNYKIYN